MLFYGEITIKTVSVEAQGRLTFVCKCKRSKQVPEYLQKYDKTILMEQYWVMDDNFQCSYHGKFYDVIIRLNRHLSKTFDSDMEMKSFHPKLNGKHFFKICKNLKGQTPEI